jgi:tripartite-type tricarboxylate transporter receptor subunit TctC
MPTVPPVGETVQGYEAMQWYGLLAPGGTPAAFIARLNTEALVALRAPETKQRLAADGAEPLGSTPEEFGAFIRRELDKWAKVAEAAKIEKQ